MYLLKICILGYPKNIHLIAQAVSLSFPGERHEQSKYNQKQVDKLYVDSTENNMECRIWLCSREHGIQLTK